jgi:hypothetical protein
MATGSAGGLDVLGWGLRLIVAACLVVDAVVHLHLAPGYQLAQPDGVGQGNLFRIEATVALVSALLVLLTGSRLAFGNAAFVGIGGLLLVLLYRYVEVPALGPIPSMYEPVWFSAKTLSAVAEAVAGLLAIAGGARGIRSRTSRSLADDRV